VPNYGSDCAENERDIGTLRRGTVLIRDNKTGNRKYVLIRLYLLAISWQLSATSVNIFSGVRNIAIVRVNGRLPGARSL